MSTQIGYALLIDTSYESQFEIEDGVYCFESRDECVDFAFDALLDAKVTAINPDGTVWSFDRQEQYESKEKAIEAFQEEHLDAFGYFHIRAWRAAKVVA